MTAFQNVAEFLDISPQDFAAVDTTPKHVSQQHGFTGERFLGAIQRRLGGAPAGTPRKTLFERVINRIEFSRALRDQLWGLLEPEVQEIEQIIGRPLDVWRSAGDSCA